MLRIELKKLERLKVVSQITAEQVEKELLEIAALDGVASVSASESLVFDCKVRVEHMGKMYDFGDYEIEIGDIPSNDYFYARRIRSGLLANVGNSYPNYYWGSDTHGFCFGGIEGDISILIQEGRLSEAAEMIVGALHAVNDDEHRDRIPETFRQGKASAYSRGKLAQIQRVNLAGFVSWKKQFCEARSHIVIEEKQYRLEVISRELDGAQRTLNDLNSERFFAGQLLSFDRERFEQMRRENLMTEGQQSDGGFSLAIRPLIDYKKKRYVLGDYTINLGSACTKASWIEILGPTIANLRGSRDGVGLLSYSPEWSAAIRIERFLSVLPEIVADLRYIPQSNMKLVPKYLQEYNGG